MSGMPTEALVVTPSQVLSDSLNPEDGNYWLSDEMFSLDKDGLPFPNFSVQEVAKNFFGKTPDWLRWRERKGSFKLNGEDILPRRSEEGNRRYTLADVERMAHALADNGAIDGMDLTIVIMLIKWMGRLYKVIE